MEVARLAARGVTNRGIGQELFISPATAARHIANIFTKLGVSSRAQLVAWIADNGPAGQLTPDGYARVRPAAQRHRAHAVLHTCRAGLHTGALSITYAWCTFLPMQWFAWRP